MRIPSLDRWSFPVLVIMVGLLVRIVASLWIPPGFDEAYYGAYSLHPAWGYYDHPPGVVPVAGLGHWLSGSFSSLSLRLGAILLFLPTAWFVYLLARDLFGEAAARWSLVLLHVTPYFMFGVGAFVIPDDPLSLSWVLFLYGLQRVRRTENPVWFLFVGLAAGLALLSKYHGMLLLGGMGISLLFFREWRRYLSSPWLWVGGVVAAGVFAPNVLWNSEHDWVSYRLQFGKGASGGLRFSSTHLIQALGGQLGYLLPWNAVLLLWALIRFTRRNAPETRWLLSFAWPPILVFTLIGVTRPILPHWPMPGYLTAVVLAGDLIVGLRPRTQERLLFGSVVTMGLALGVLVLQALTGILPLKGGADPTLDGQGWRALIAELDVRGLDGRGATFLIAHKWYTAGQLAWADEGRHSVVVLPPGAPHGFAYWEDPQALGGQDGLFICNERFSADPSELYRGQFAAFVKQDDILTYRAGRLAHRFEVWLCSDYLATQ